MRDRIPSTPITKPVIPSNQELKTKYENKIKDTRHQIENEYFNPFDVVEKQLQKKSKSKKKKSMYNF
jgi:ferritin-like metal-binding protein YciE